MGQISYNLLKKVLQHFANMKACLSFPLASHFTTFFARACAEIKIYAFRFSEFFFRLSFFPFVFFLLQ